MGARTAEVAADTVCIAGFCGAASPELAPGDVVLATEVRSDDGVRSCAASPLLEEPLQRLGLRVTTGPIYSTAHVAGPAERERLRGSGVLAVDMESYWLAEAADGTPVAVVRVIVDRAGRRLLHPATLPAGVRAFRALRRTAPALAALDALPQPEPLRY
jgi:4-hydroxy-3-methylbut-2-enyl diphosphate reductase